MVLLVRKSFFWCSQLWVVSKNGLFWRLVQDSHFLNKWSGQSFPREDSFSLDFTLFSDGGMAQIGEWSRFNNQRQAFPRVNSFSPACTLFSAGGIAWIGNGPGSEIGIGILHFLRRIVQIAHHWCFTFLGKMLFQYLTDVSGRMYHMIQFIS